MSTLKKALEKLPFALRTLSDKLPEAPELKKKAAELPSTLATLSDVLPKNVFGQFPENEYRPEGIRLRAVLTADWHTDADPLRDRTDILRRGLCGIAATSRVDAVILAGDITNSGHIKEYKLLKRLFTVYANAQKAIPQFGNHDCRGTSIYPYYHEAEQLFEDFCRFCGRDIHVPYYLTTVNGYYFIVMGTDKLMHNTMYVSPEQLEWLDRTLALASTSGKPIFVINHQSPDTRNGIPEKWAVEGGIGEQSEAVEAILAKYSAKNKILFVSGHLHRLDDKSFEKANENLYFLNLPSFEYNDGTGFIMDVYDDRIELLCRSFITGIYTPDHHRTIGL